MTTPSPTLFSTRLSAVGLVAAVFLLLATQVCSEAYYGKLIGKLSELHHGVSGEVYAVDGRTLFIKNFAYDGEAPTAYFYVGTSKSPNGNGIRLRDENGSTDTLKRYRRKDITLTLPDGKTLNNIKWFSVWCDEYAVNFGDVRIPRGFDYPKPQKLAALSGVHSVSSEPIVVVDAQTLLIPSFSYDGEAPDAKFWAGAGPSPSPQGIRIPDENGKVVPLRQYNRKTIVLTLPGDLTIHQIGHFGVWCEAFTVDFGHVQIPTSLNVPPSLKMLGVSPQNVHRGGQGQTLGLANHYELSPSSSSSSSSSPPQSETESQSHSSYLASALLTEQQYQRPTTYRPILRREDQVQVVQAIDYRISKNAQAQEPLARQLGRLQQNSYPEQTGRSAATVRYDDDVSNLDDAAYQEQFRSVGSSVLDASQPADQSRLRNPLAGERLANSYARVLRFQGDKRLDSFVRY
ncbi:protein Skeletor, isoforms B/C isoform X3 [Hylaeus volcanicus]|uniref:protein Skeletor, isoforms B/C isoform X3 n=1 Tax=Hylaeus volcanicus TaxID=313075 RepID=UPI0023B82934|nr:protein Skeletor, isoforms B/C isoform X3 [Hylaeus volcanicus]